MPPSSSGNGRPNRPSSAIWSSTSGSSRSARSIASALGPTTASANCRTILRNSSCSGDSSTSMRGSLAPAAPWWARVGRTPHGRPAGPMLAGALGVVLEAEQGEVVVVAAAGVPVDQLDQVVERLGERAFRHHLLEPGPVEELPGLVARLHQAVGVADQALAGAELALVLGGLGAEPERGRDVQ